MTAFEIVSIFIGILALLIAFGSFVIGFSFPYFCPYESMNIREKDITVNKCYKKCLIRISVDIPGKRLSVPNPK